MLAALLPPATAAPYTRATIAPPCTAVARDRLLTQVVRFAGPPTPSLTRPQAARGPPERELRPAVGRELGPAAGCKLGLLT
jgi:hypothetical protein